MPLIYDLTNLNIGIDIKKFTPYLTVLIALLLVSKIPTLALKKDIHFSKATVFLLLGIGIVFYSFVIFIHLKRFLFLELLIYFQYL
jgi:phosphatidylserine synthase